jgi:hypothetical protein
MAVPARRYSVLDYNVDEVECREEDSIGDDVERGSTARRRKGSLGGCRRGGGGGAERRGGAERKIGTAKEWCPVCTRAQRDMGIFRKGGMERKPL